MDRKRLEKSDRTGQPDDLGGKKQVSYAMTHLQSSGLASPAYNWWNEALHGVARAGPGNNFPAGNWTWRHF